MKPRHEPNLVPYIARLNAKEKSVLCHVLSLWRSSIPQAVEQGTPDIHPGVLPFIAHRDAVCALNTIIDKGNGVQPGLRLFKQIRSKLLNPKEAGFGGSSNFTRFVMKLDDAKVYRVFGAHPERGKPLTFLPKEKVTAGMKWSLPKKRYEPDKDVLVTPCVTMHRITQGFWRVEVLSRCQHTVEQWLMEKCR